MFVFAGLVLLLVASKLQDCLLENCEISKALELDVVEPIDYALKYFLYKRFCGDLKAATLLVLGAPRDNPYATLIVGRSTSHDNMFQLTLTVRNTLLRGVSEDIANKFFENKFNFRELSQLSNLTREEEIRDVMVNVWSMDSVILAKLYYFIESRTIPLGNVIPELKYVAERGEKYAHILLGYAYLYGIGVEKDLDKALEHFWSGRSDRNPSALTGIGRVMMDEECRDDESSINAFKLALTEGNDAEANFCLFLLIDKNNTTEFDQHGYLRNAAYAGYLPAVHQFALHYADQKFYEASNHSLMSVTQFHPTFLELDSKAVKAYLSKNYKKALMIYLFLAEFNLQTALKNAVYILENHDCIDNRDMILFSIYDSLAQSQAEYHRHLGDCYYYGKGVEQSYTQAVSSYLASRKLSSESAYNLAYMYENGLGVPRNLYQALHTLDRYLNKERTYLVRFYALARIYIKIALCVHYIATTVLAIVLISISTAYVFKK